MPPDLPARLKAETRALHRAAERTTFMAGLMRGQVARPAYCSLLRSLHAIYAALESALAQYAHEAALAPGRLPGLARTAAIEQDLLALHGRQWRDEIDLQPESARYARRLQGLHPPLLLAHAYVRYLGDLSGGQMLLAVVGRSIALSDGRGTAFYDFGGEQQTRELAAAFRAALAAVVLDGPTVDAVVAEAQRAFHMHHRLFESLGGASDSIRAAAGKR